MFWHCFSGNQRLSLRLWGNQRYNDKTPQNTLFIIAPNFMGAYAPPSGPLCPTHPVFCSAPPSHEPVAPMRRAQKNIGVLFFSEWRKKGKAGLVLPVRKSPWNNSVSSWTQSCTDVSVPTKNSDELFESVMLFAEKTDTDWNWRWFTSLQIRQQD